MKLVRFVKIAKRIFKGVIWFITPLLTVSLLFLIIALGIIPKTKWKSDSKYEKFKNLGIQVFLSNDKYGWKKDYNPTIILVGGSGGGFWHDKSPEDIKMFNEQGFHVICLGWHRIKGLNNDYPVEIEPVSRLVDHFSKKYPDINKNVICILGISKGSELVLNVAARSDQFKAVVALVPPFVNFQYNNVGLKSLATFSWKGKELPFVPLASKGYLAFETLLGGELNQFNTALLNKNAVDKAIIPVENISAPLLLISGKYDDVWPSFVMSEQIINRLEKNNFKYDIIHFALETNHYVLHKQESWDIIFDFLKQELTKVKETN